MRKVGIGVHRALLAPILIIVLAAPVAAQQEQITPPPPAWQFREGDRWQSWGQDASGRPTDSLKVYEKRNGAWTALAGIDDRAGERDARSFEQLKDPIFYPAAPDPDEIVATVDGLLHRYVNGQWIDLPIGATMTDRRGTVYRIDVRATAYDADQLSQAFQHSALNEQPLGESVTGPVLLPTPDKLVAAIEAPSQQKPVEPPVAGPGREPPPTAAKEAAAEPASSSVSLAMGLLYLLLGAGLALALVKVLGRKPTPPNP